MIENRLAFACRACKKVHDIVNVSDKKGFEIVAFGDVVEWSDFNDELPLLENNIWERSTEPPQKGVIKIVQAHFPFNFAIGEEFWTLFYPALSSLNGWDVHPEEIDSSAVIKCRFESIITKNEEKAWINVRVEEVILLSDICEKITPREGILNADHFGQFRNYNMFSYQNWILLNAGSEGDIGRWALVKEYRNQNIIVAYGEWDFYSDLIYFGNVRLTQNEMNELIKLFS